MRISDHGDDRYRFPDVSFVADFSSNVPALPFDEELWQYLSAHRALIHRYPEPQAISLERQIALKVGIDEASILVTSGATEAIYLIGHLFHHAKSLILQPTFSEYGHSTKMYGHIIQNCLGSDFFDDAPDIEPSSVVWLCNPNNPTGTTYDYTHLYGTISAHPDAIFVVDQSYAAFTPMRVLSPEEASDLPNCFVIQSLTKTYAIPGLRLGYVIAHPRLIDQLKQLKMPWSVNVLALQAGAYLLSRDVPFHLVQLLEERKRWVSQLEKLDIMDIYPTDTHYFLAQLKRHRAEDLKNWLAHNYALLIRNADNYPLLGERHIRLATQSAEDNNLLLSALSKIPAEL